MSEDYPELPDFEFSDEVKEELAAQEEKSKQREQDIVQEADEIIAEEESEYQMVTEFFAWQICFANVADNSLSDADNYPEYFVNKETIMQMLGIGMATGQNAYALNDEMYVVAISEKKDDDILMLGTEDPRYKAVAAVVSEQLLAGSDQGMIAQLPNGKLVPMKPPVDPSKL